MTTKLKGLTSLGVMAASFALVTAFSPKTPANNRVVKYSVFHNGHYLCLPKPAVIAHLREHKDDKFSGCCENCPDKPWDGTLPGKDDKSDSETDPIPVPTPVPPAN